MRKEVIAVVAVVVVVILGGAAWAIQGRTTDAAPTANGIAQTTAKTPEATVERWLDLVVKGDEVAAWEMLQMDEMSKGALYAPVFGWRESHGYRSAALDGPIEQLGATTRANVRFVNDHGLYLGKDQAGTGRCWTLTLAEDTAAATGYSIVGIKGLTCADAK